MKVAENSELYDWRERRAVHARLRDVILPGIISAALGSILGAYVSIPISLVFSLGVVAVVVLHRAIAGKFKSTTIMSVFILALCSGIMNGEIHRDETRCAHEEPSLYREGVVIDEPANGKFTVRTHGLCGDVQVRSSSSNMIYGDRIAFISKLELPEDFRTESDVVFRYRDLLRARGVGYVTKTYDIKKLSGGEGSLAIKKLLELKSWFKVRFAQIPEPESTLLAGMLLGGSSDLPKDIQQDFITSSLIHIVVLSGANLAFVAGGALIIGRKFLGFRAGLIAAGAVSILYALMGGMGPATIRALFMVLLIFLGKFLFREAHGGRILLVSASVLTIINPYLPRDDPSFQLSVLALFGLIYLAPLIERQLPERLRSGVREYVAAIFGAQLLVLPLIVHMSGVLSPWGFIANILVLWLLVAVPYLSLILLIPLGGLLTVICSFPLVVMLSYVIAVAHGVARFPYSQIRFTLGTFGVLVVYALLLAWIWSKWRRGNMSPLSIFVEKENARLLRAGRIPWVE